MTPEQLHRMKLILRCARIGQEVTRAEIAREIQLPMRNIRAIPRVLSAWRKSGELITGYNARGYYLCTTNGEIAQAAEHLRNMGLSILVAASVSKQDRETMNAL